MHELYDAVWESMRDDSCIIKQHKIDILLTTSVSRRQHSAVDGLSTFTRALVRFPYISTPQVAMQKRRSNGDTLKQLGNHSYKQSPQLIELSVPVLNQSKRTLQNCQELNISSITYQLSTTHLS